VLSQEYTGPPDDGGGHLTSRLGVIREAGFSAVHLGPAPYGYGTQAILVNGDDPPTWQ
jgi:hypothetical protein